MSISFFVSLKQVSEFMLVASESSKLSLSEMFWFVFDRCQIFSWSQCHQTRFVVALYDDAWSFVFVLVGETSDLLLCRGAETNVVGVTIFFVNWH